MGRFEEKARELKSQGYNCSYSVYTSLKDELKLKGEYPAPRSVDGKCGALLVALKVLEDINNGDKKVELENEFIEKFGYCKCVDLMTNSRRCSDYVGWVANKIEEIIKQ